MKDGYGRNIDYMRVSVTERCNLRCAYCIGREASFGEDALTLDEISAVCRAGAELGIRKIKLTGGEPLLREDIVSIVKAVRAIEGITSVTLTTNGVLLSRYAEALKKVGIDSINVSLDTLDREKYSRITGFDCLSQVISGIKDSISLGIPIRINAVLTDKSDFETLASTARDNPIDVRFIEMMPIGRGKGFVPIKNSEIIAENMDLKKASYRGNGPCVYYEREGYRGRIGFISPLSGNFCRGCNRIRLTSKGFLKGCLCYSEGLDVRGFINDKEGLRAAIKKVIENKPEGHCFHDITKITETKDMNEIGG